MTIYLGIGLISFAAILLFKQYFRGRELTALSNPKEAFQSFYKKTEENLSKRLGEKKLSKLGSDLEQAGISKRASLQFVTGQFLSMLGGFFLGALLIWFGMPTYFIIPTTALGFVIPKYRLKKKAFLRKRAIVLSLPYYLDLFTLALEAGVDLIAAIEEVVSRDSDNPLQEELLITLKSIRMGEVRSEAFQKLAERTDVEPLKLFSGCITQSEELGASLGGLLRLQADSLRREIFKEAEVRAQKAPVKMLLPLIALIFPVVFILLFSPIALRFLLGAY